MNQSTNAHNIHHQTHAQCFPHASEYFSAVCMCLVACENMNEARLYFMGVLETRGP